MICEYRGERIPGIESNPFIKKVLCRYCSDWSNLISLAAWNAIRYREEYSENEKIAEYVLLITHQGQDLLLDKDKRRILVQLLKQEEITELAKLLNIKSSPKIYKNVIDTKLTGETRKIFCKYYEIPEISEIEQEEVPDREELESAYPLHSYQKDVLLRATKTYNEESNNNFMIHMPTGSGKTRVAMSFISRILMQSDKTIVVWLAYSEELCEQAVSEFKKSWAVLGDRNISVERLFGSHSYTDIEDGLLVAGLGKLWSMRKKDYTFIPFLSKLISAVVFDEAHQSLAPTYFEMLKEIQLYNPNVRFIGLSATPGRTDESESQGLSSLFSNKKITLRVPGYDSPIRFLYEQKYLSTPSFTQISYKSGINLKEYDSGEINLDYSDQICKALGNDYERNAKIIDQVMECLKKGHTRIIVFAASVDSAELLNALLTLEGVTSLVLTSNTDSEIRKQIIETFKSNFDKPIVLCNYGILTTGFDAPKITAAVIGRPTKSLILYSQMVGRALRGSRMGGTDTAEIYVMVDIDLPGANSVIEAFEQWGNANEWIEQ